MFIEKSKGNPVVSAVGLVLGDAACYVLGTAWFVFQMQCELGYALTVCVYPLCAGRWSKNRGFLRIVGGAAA